ncbi:MAG: alpha/beta hydrolase [Alphaproteobacteria bacterium]|nr:alpha/beta hydrolase [Alphaproteobacteria bacterium]
MYSLAHQNVLIDECRIACATYGEGDPVILIHGTPSSSLIWREVVPVLNAAGYAVHLFDLLGFGLSERPWSPAVDTSVAGQVPILRGLMGHWGLDHAHIVAHDIGGAVAQRFTLENPDMVRTLTLIDSVSFDSWPSERTRQQMRDGLEALIRSPDIDHRAHFRDWLLSTVVDRKKLSDGPLDAYVDIISGIIGQASLFAHQVGHYDPRYTDELTPELHRLGDRPVQILWGAEDAWQTTNWAEKLHAAIPGSALHIIPDCGHFAMEDRPEEIARLIVSFLREGSGANASPAAGRA